MSTAAANRGTAICRRCSHSGQRARRPRRLAPRTDPRPPAAGPPRASRPRGRAPPYYREILGAGRRAGTRSCSRRPARAVEGDARRPVRPDRHRGRTSKTRRPRGAPPRPRPRGPRTPSLPRLLDVGAERPARPVRLRARTSSGSGWPWRSGSCARIGIRRRDPTRRDRRPRARSTSPGSSTPPSAGPPGRAAPNGADAARRDGRRAQRVPARCRHRVRERAALLAREQLGASCGSRPGRRGQRRGAHRRGPGLDARRRSTRPQHLRLDGGSCTSPRARRLIPASTSPTTWRSSRSSTAQPPSPARPAATRSSPRTSRTGRSR